VCARFLLSHSASHISATDDDGGGDDDGDDEVDVMYAFAARKRGGTLPPSFAVNTHKYDLLFTLVVDRPISDEDDDEADWPRRELTVTLSYNEELPRSRSPSSSSTAAKDSSGDGLGPLPPQLSPLSPSLLVGGALARLRASSSAAADTLTGDGGGRARASTMMGFLDGGGGAGVDGDGKAFWGRRQRWRQWQWEQLWRQELWQRRPPRLQLLLGWA